MGHQCRDHCRLRWLAGSLIFVDNTLLICAILHCLLPPSSGAGIHNYSSELTKLHHRQIVLNLNTAEAGDQIKYIIMNVNTYVLSFPPDLLAQSLPMANGSLHI